MINVLKGIMRNCLLIFLFMMVCSAVNAQTKNEPENKKYAAAGTYQFIVSNSKPEYVFTTDILLKIEENRNDDEVVFLKVAPTIEVKILSRKQINASDFKPVEEFVYTDK